MRVLVIKASPEAVKTMLTSSKNPNVTLFARSLIDISFEYLDCLHAEDLATGKDWLQEYKFDYVIPD